MLSRRGLLRSLLAVGVGGALLPVEEVMGLFVPKRTFFLPPSQGWFQDPMTIRLHDGSHVVLGEWEHIAIRSLYREGLLARTVL